MVETTEIVRDLLAGRVVSYPGTVFDLDGVGLCREPVDVPLLCGGAWARRWWPQRELTRTASP
jgi:hypothetical protein